MALNQLDVKMARPYGVESASVLHIYTVSDFQSDYDGCHWFVMVRHDSPVNCRLYKLRARIRMVGRWTAPPSFSAAATGCQSYSQLAIMFWFIARRVRAKKNKRECALADNTIIHAWRMREWVYSRLGKKQAKQRFTCKMGSVYYSAPRYGGSF